MVGSSLDVNGNFQPNFGSQFSDDSSAAQAQQTETPVQGLDLRAIAGDKLVNLNTMFQQAGGIAQYLMSIGAPQDLATFLENEAYADADKDGKSDPAYYISSVANKADWSDGGNQNFILEAQEFTLIPELLATHPLLKNRGSRAATIATAQNTAMHNSSSPATAQAGQLPGQTPPFAGNPGGVNPQLSQMTQDPRMPQQNPANEQQAPAPQQAPWWQGLMALAAPVLGVVMDSVPGLRSVARQLGPVAQNLIGIFSLFSNRA